MTLFRSPIVVLDTETSGLPRDSWANVIELAAVYLNMDGDEIGTFSTLVDQPDLPPMADEAMAVSGITRDMLDRAPSAHAVHWMFGAWMQERDWPYVTSYNVAFDRRMMMRLSVWDPMQWAPCIMEKAMDVMGPASKLRDADPNHYRFNPDRPWLYPKLVDAAAFFGVEHDPQNHRALDDARLAANVLCEMRRRG